MNWKWKIGIIMGGLALANGVFYGLTSCSGSNLPPDSVNGFVITNVKTDAGNPTQNWTQGADKEHLILTLWSAVGKHLSLFLVYYYINKTQYEVVPQTNISGLVENTDVATFFNSLEGNRSGIYEAGLGQTYAFVHVDYQNKSVDYTFNVTVTEAPNS